MRNAHMHKHMQEKKEKKKTIQNFYMTRAMVTGFLNIPGCNIPVLKRQNSRASQKVIPHNLYHFHNKTNKADKRTNKSTYSHNPNPHVGFTLQQFATKAQSGDHLRSSPKNVLEDSNGSKQAIPK